VKIGMPARGDVCPFACQPQIQLRCSTRAPIPKSANPCGTLWCELRISACARRPSLRGDRSVAP
jgi:hypothetical protein